MTFTYCKTFSGPNSVSKTDKDCPSLHCKEERQLEIDFASSSSSDLILAEAAPLGWLTVNGKVEVHKSHCEIRNGLSMPMQ